MRYRLGFDIVQFVFPLEAKVSIIDNFFLRLKDGIALSSTNFEILTIFACKIAGLKCRNCKIGE